MTGLIVAPRMEARKKRLGEVHTARDTFGAHMTRIIAVCVLLHNTPLPTHDDPDWTTTMRERPAGERDRWLQQLDDSTLGLIDNVATYAGSWPERHLIQFATGYAGTTRINGAHGTVGAQPPRTVSVNAGSMAGSRAC